MFSNLKTACAALLLSVGLLAMPACSSINKGAAAIGLGVEFENVFSEAAALEDQVYLAAGLYTATLIALDSQCAGSASNDILFAACDKAAQAADRLEPGVDAILATASVYVKSKADLDKALAENGAASPEAILAVSAAAANLALEFSRIRDDLRAFVSNPSAN